MLPSVTGHEAQVEFDRLYISSSEICKNLGLHRTTLLQAIHYKRLPEPIVLLRPGGSVHLMLWRRVDIAGALDNWAAKRAGA